MKIGILYICTGRYECFWDKFYESAEKFFLPEHEKHYYVFTDAPAEKFKDERIHRIEQNNLGWPDNTLKRFHMFHRIKDELKNYDYLFFFNANAVFKKFISEEILPSAEEGLVVVQHPGFYKNRPDEFTYDRNPGSAAFIPFGTGKYYVCGGVNGGRAGDFLRMIEHLRNAIDLDEKNGVMALWHDESHLNKYIMSHNFKMLPPSYAYPERRRLPFEPRIVILSKSKHGGLEYLRGNANIPSKKTNKMGNTVKKIAKRIFHAFYGKFAPKPKNIVPKIIIKVDGGLGSQMWQFALGVAINSVCGLPVKYDLTWFRNNGKDTKKIENRNFELLNIFTGRFDFQIASEEEIDFYEKYFFYKSKKYCEYEESVCTSKEPRYLGGYYCNIKYIKHIREKLQELFQPTIKFSDENEKMLKIISSCGSAVAVHVRRGDYAGSMYDVTTPNYFSKSMEFISEKLSNPIFFVFSDDMEYTKNIFEGLPYKIMIVDKNDNDSGYADMHLMRHCKHFIISNSSFGWWAAFLASNADKIVVAPGAWFNEKSGKKYAGHETAYIDDGWHII